MEKGQLLQGYFMFFVVFMTLLTFIMSASGWTGITGDYVVNNTIADNPDISEGAFVDNMLGLLSFQSEYILFNLFLIISYTILIAFAVDLLWL